MVRKIRLRESIDTKYAVMIQDMHSGGYQLIVFNNKSDANVAYDILDDLQSREYDDELEEFEYEDTINSVLSNTVDVIEAPDFRREDSMDKEGHVYKNYSTRNKPVYILNPDSGIPIYY